MSLRIPYAHGDIINNPQGIGNILSSNFLVEHFHTVVLECNYSGEYQCCNSINNKDDSCCGISKGIEESRLIRGTSGDCLIDHKVGVTIHGGREGRRLCINPI